MGMRQRNTFDTCLTVAQRIESFAAPNVPTAFQVSVLMLSVVHQPQER